jgi:uncharacterized protein involved in outer membrane biogenesis
LEQPSVELIRKKDGTWNFATLGSSSNGGSSDGPSVDRLKIVDGVAGYTDLSAAKVEPRQQYDHIDVDLRGYAPGRTDFKVDADAHLPGEGNPSISWSGSGTAGKLKLSNVTVRSVQQFLKQKDAADLDAVITGEVDARYENTSASAQGKVHIERLRIKKSSLPFPVDVQLDAKYDTKSKLADLKTVELAVGSAKLNASGTVAEDKANLKLTTTRTPIEELLKLAAAFGAGADPSMHAKGLLSADITASGPLTGLAYNGSVEASGLEVTNTAWKQPVRVAALKLAMTPQDIRSEPFQIESGGTKLAGSLLLSNYAGDASSIDATVRADNASVTELLSVAQAFGFAAPGVTGTGLVDLDVQAKGPSKHPKLSGRGRIDNAQLQLPGISKPVAIPALVARFEQDGVWIDQMQANLAGSKLQGKLSVRDFSDPVVQFALDIDKWNTTEMQKLLGGESGAASSTGKPSAFSRATGGGSVRIGVLEVSDLTLNQVNATCTLNHGVIVLDPVKAEMYGGGITGRITGDLRKSEPLVTVKAKFDQVDANRLVSAATPLKQVLMGKFSADSDLQLTATGGAAEIAKSLNGTIALRLGEGRLNGVNMINEISKFAKFFGYAAEPTAFTDFVKMGGTLKIANGIAQTNDLGIEMKGAKFSGSGTLNFAAQTMDMRFGAVLDSEFSQRVGGTKVGGFMATALADEKGQLIIPTMVRGSIAKPNVMPDAEQFAKLKVKSLIPGLGAPGTAQDPKQTVKGVIDLFRKKRPEQPPPPPGKQ